jgi:hypothetical protein
MEHARHIGFILAAVLLVSSFLSAVRAGARLLLRRGAGASRLALVGRFGSGHPTHHLDIRPHEG